MNLYLKGKARWQDLNSFYVTYISNYRKITNPYKLKVSGIDPDHDDDNGDHNDNTDSGIDISICRVHHNMTLEILTC